MKRTLRRWTNPNTQRNGRSILVSFYDWAMEEEVRKDNPARQTDRPEKQPTTVYGSLVAQETKRVTGRRPVVLAWVWQYQPRGVLHKHVVLGVRSAEERRAADVYVCFLAKLAGSIGLATSTAGDGIQRSAGGRYAR